MADNCKFQKNQYQVSYDSGTTWQNVVPEQVKKGELIQYDSSDCTSIETMYRWRVLDGQYLCDGDNKYKKEIREESYNGGLTWYVSYPTVYRTGQFVSVDSNFCNDKFEGHYYYNPPEISSDCPSGYYWNGVQCVFIVHPYEKPIDWKAIDPLKVVKCNDSAELTRSDLCYYGQSDFKTYGLFDCTIGDCVESIEGFWGNTYIKSIGDKYSDADVKISSSVTTVGAAAFSGCSSLSSVTIPNTVTSIGNGCFIDCSGLTSVTIGSGLTSIKSGMFKNCTKLKRVNGIAYQVGDGQCVIPDNITKIYDGFSDSFSTDGAPFQNCSGITGIYIGSGLTDYGAACFKNCRNINYISVSANNPKYDSRDNCSAVITTSSSTLVQGCMATVIPSGVTGIAQGAFYYGSAPSALTIPDTVNRIGSDAFTECTGLKNIDIMGSVTIFGKAFYASSVSRVRFYGTSVDVYSQAFKNCTSLNFVYFYNITSVPYFYSDAFANTTCYFYVPSSLLRACQNEWKNYISTSRIQAIP